MRIGHYLFVQVLMLLVCVGVYIQTMVWDSIFTANELVVIYGTAVAIMLFTTTAMVASREVKE